MLITAASYVVLLPVFIVTLCYLLTYLLTQWKKVLFMNLTGMQLVKKLSTFYGTRLFITAFKNARHLSLSVPAQSTPYNILLLEDPS
jgi:hypothetical protein